MEGIWARSGSEVAGAGLLRELGSDEKVVTKLGVAGAATGRKKKGG